MDLRQLRYVEAVARTANFTHAAAELHVAQPALSHAISRLEAELGLRLFDRTSRRVSLTDGGASFVAGARRILAEVDALEDEAAQFAGAVLGRVRVSVWYHVEPDRLAMIRDFIHLYPLVQFSIVELPGPEMLDALRRSELDLAFPMLVPGSDLSDVDYDILRDEPLALAICRDDPLAAARRVTLAELARTPLIATRLGTGLRTLIDGAFDVVGVRPPIAVETNELAAAVAYASIGVGAAVLTRRIIERTGQPVAIIPIADGPPFRTALAWSRLRHRGPAAERALEFARSRRDQAVARG